MAVLPQQGAPPARTPKLLFSVPCARGVAGCAPGGGGKRGWQGLAQRDAASLNSVRDARGVAFLDMDEDVRVLSALHCAL